MVSTDNQEIATVAKKYGADVPFYRSDKNSNDFATTIDVLLEVIEEYEKRGIFFETICCLYPTAPLISSKKLKEAFEIFNRTTSDSLIPVVAYSFPPQRGNIIEEGKVKYLYPEFSLKRSQDLEKIYHDCGQFYICKTEAIKNKKRLITDNSIPYIMPEEEVQDIDNLSDWKLAEMKYKLINHSKNLC